ncbi:uncharacterized protein ASCRUDRAFT_132666 [Ascoidea rubescens DSM 1968]|uniref:Uncharacterized protein n=1 Tax=Ascoidea rubescens DSM 1968 TaxID=1344418 RepID=A0A1D2VKP5_9ASCO|nr:hypothetical protein ASCRUDRAFT_132666 [Ascoidea rubescens DSM 1968]ODV62181.1 hypothetical protein ASCRUDRAFT_132666 [Ascoidea rubescens DSM 1968]
MLHLCRARAVKSQRGWTCEQRELQSGGRTTRDRAWAVVPHCACTRPGSGERGLWASSATRARCARLL